jgi:hypothetical protein
VGHIFSDLGAPIKKVVAKIGGTGLGRSKDKDCNKECGLKLGDKKVITF